jgi:F0F1-type ATP synthase delta subunit
MYSELNNLVRTEDERESLKEELKTLSDSLFEKEGSFEQALVGKIRPQTGEAVKKLLAEGRVLDKVKFFKEAEKYLESLPVLELTVAFDPKGTSVERIWQWVRRNVGEGIILKFAVDHSIGAGAIVVFRGKFRDFTLKKLLEHYFDASKLSLDQLIS